MIRDAWLVNLPIGRIAGEPPAIPLSNLDTLQAVVATAKTGEILADVVGIRSSTIAEGIFLIHKALHVLRAAQVHGTCGMPSWALFSAYHSAYLGAKGVMAMLGVAIPQVSGRQIVIDLFPQSAPRHTRKRRLGTENFSTFRLLFTDRIDQRYFWELFLRVLRLANVEIWNEQVGRNILALNWEEISPPRNRFIYNSAFWPLEDLFDAVGPDIFVERLRQVELDAESVAFLLELGCSVACLAEGLLADLADAAPSVAAELARGSYRSGDWPERNPLYQEFVLTYGIHR